MISVVKSNRLRTGAIYEIIQIKYIAQLACLISCCGFSSYNDVIKIIVGTCLSEVFNSIE